MQTRNFGCDKVSRCEMSHLLADRCSRHIQSVFNLIMDIHVMVNWQLSKRYPLTSVTWLIAGASEQLIEVKCSFTVSVLINRRHWSIFFFRRNSLFLLTQKLNCLKKTFLKKSQRSFTVGRRKSIYYLYAHLEPSSRSVLRWKPLAEIDLGTRLTSTFHFLYIVLL